MGKKADLDIKEQVPELKKILARQSSLKGEKRIKVLDLY